MTHRNTGRRGKSKGEHAAGDAASSLFGQLTYYILTAIIVAAFAAGLVFVWVPDKIVEYSGRPPGQWRVMGLAYLLSLFIALLVMWWYHTPNTRKAILFFFIPATLLAVMVLTGRSPLNMRAFFSGSGEVNQPTTQPTNPEGKGAEKPLGQGKLEGGVEKNGDHTMNWPDTVFGGLCFLMFAIYLWMYLRAAVLDK